tara:strand:+ start:131 stop:1135 length:1005 start_codon:yes stop_codon:yes gene_type:complete
MKKLLVLLIFFFSTNAYSIPRFGELTEIFDPNMRGKEDSLVRPHPGPFVWEMIEPEEGSFFWKEADRYVQYSQDHNQIIIATIWPYTKWDQKSCNRKKSQSPFGGHFPNRLGKPCSMEKYLFFLSLVVDRYDGDGNNDMPGLTNPILHWEIMNEPEFKMFFSGKEDEFVEIFIESSKLIKAKQKDAVIIMAGAAGMHPDSKRFWSSALPKIENYFDIANIHHITGPEGGCDKEMWVDEFSKLLNSKNINKPIWVTEAMTGKCEAIDTYINAFLSGAEVIIDVGVNAPGPKMSTENRNKLDNLIEKFNDFKSIRKLSINKVEFELNNGSLIKFQY